MSENIVITGMGIVSPYGVGNTKFIEAYNNNADALRPITVFSDSSYTHAKAGEIVNFLSDIIAEKKKMKRINRVAQILIEAIEHLLTNYGLKNNSEESPIRCFDPTTVGGVIGTYSSLKSISDFDFQLLENPQYVTPSDFTYCVTCSSLGFAAIVYKLMACGITIANGETSSLESFELGCTLIRTKKAGMIIAGGLEEISQQQALMFQNRAKFYNIPNPVLGEGAAVFSLEEKEQAVARSAAVLAEIIDTASCYDTNNPDGIKYNLAEIKNRSGQIYDAVEYVFPAENEVDKALINHIPHKKLVTDKIGYLCSANGAFKLAAAIVDKTIPGGAYIIINDASVDGNCSSMLIRKC